MAAVGKLFLGVVLYKSLGLRVKFASGANNCLSVDTTENKKFYVVVSGENFYNGIDTRFVF